MHDWWWSDALVYTSSNGTRFGKATILKGAAQPSQPGAPEVTYTAEGVQVTAYGDIATLAFRLVAMTDGNRSEYLNSATLRREAGQWRVVQWQATKVPEATLDD